ncbi:MAG: hypothetical protein JO022_02095, partial [Acidobacteriaceae bacterium]|nr:hypothetical protein [Acidobacteriaceae bacterium]
CLIGAPISDPAALVRAKLQSIEKGTVPRGSTVIFTSAELTAYARSVLPATVPQGVRDPRLELGNGTATGYALIDFLKLQQNTETPWLIAKLIQGERPVKVTAKIESARGKATVFLERVEISGIGVSGYTLQFLIDNFFRPLYPNAKINQPFDLAACVDHLEVSPAAARVIIRK